MDSERINDLINNIESGTLADAEDIFNDIMDLKAGEQLDQMRQDVAAGIFNEPSDEDEFDHYEVYDDDASPDELDPNEDDDA